MGFLDTLRSHLPRLSGPNRRPYTSAGSVSKNFSSTQQTYQYSCQITLPGVCELRKMLGPRLRAYENGYIASSISPGNQRLLELARIAGVSRAFTLSVKLDLYTFLRASRADKGEKAVAFSAKQTYCYYGAVGIPLSASIATDMRYCCCFRASTVTTAARTASHDLRGHDCNRSPVQMETRR